MDKVDLAGANSDGVDVAPDLDSLDFKDGGNLWDSLLEPDGGAVDVQEKEAVADSENGADEPDGGAVDDAEVKEADSADSADLDDNEDYIEIATSDDSQPVKLKLSEVIDGYKSAEDLREKLAVAQQEAALPAEVEQQLVQTTQARSEYLQGLQVMQKMIQPTMPDDSMLDPNNQNYNPEAYSAQLQNARDQQQMRADIQAESQRVAQEQAQQQEIISQSRMAREWTKAIEAWPELKDKDTRDKAVQDFSEAYGFSSQEVQAIGDHRVLNVLRDALSYRSQKAQLKATEKVIAAKPKLVRASARQAADRRSPTATKSFDQLTKSGSFEDAIDSLAAML